MQHFLVIVCCLIILSVCVAGAFGFWHFVNSSAAEAQAWAIVDGISEGVVLLSQGLLAVLIALAVGVFLFLAGKGLQAGSEAAGKGVATYMLAKRAAELMPPLSSVETRDIKVFSSQVAPPADGYVIGGELPIQRACLPSPARQTDGVSVQTDCVGRPKP